MKNTNPINLLLALAILVIFFCIISVIASPADIRYSWAGINPWNSVRGVALMLKRFLDFSPWVINTLSALIIAYLWWRIYALIKKLRRENSRE